MDGREAWNRAKFADHLHGLKVLVQMYEERSLTTSDFVDNVNAWSKVARTKPANQVALLAKMRTEWAQTEDIEVLRKYNDLGVTVREIGAAIGVSGSAITRWLNGTRTRRVISGQV